MVRAMSEVVRSIQTTELSAARRLYEAMREEKPQLPQWEEVLSGKEAKIDMSKYPPLSDRTFSRKGGVWILDFGPVGSEVMAALVVRALNEDYTDLTVTLLTERRGTESRTIPLAGRAWRIKIMP